MDQAPARVPIGLAVIGVGDLFGLKDAGWNGHAFAPFAAQAAASGLLWPETKNTAGRPRRSQNPIIERTHLIAEQRLAVK
jgi:hypothetical protein